ncbi:toxin [Corynebacterium bovis]|uniref:Toxin n=1 Tax=Corynebacterium bovis TaxID=36808 RepID=A0A426PX22_9CORY|nr:toxin [Corynebacterium bovis]MDN8578331.1 toxin [Corynebacterium bovis]RRO85702.1 toxin [Corynebacterium bovis]RRQ06192.1 toxin [Corynebacterium bovis]RRQ09192.1 toxin [Corynebacterium bovis]
MSPDEPRLALHRSARKHFRRDHLTAEAVIHAVDHALSSRPLDDESNPRRWLTLGVDPAGRILELVLLIFDDGTSLIIHAMKARKHYISDI